MDDYNNPCPRFIEPCGQDEGQDRCWYCGLPRSAHHDEVTADGR